MFVEPVLEAEIIVQQEEIRNILNSGLKICCPKCHSHNYDIYPTGINPWNRYDSVNDIWYICLGCKTKWPSGFLQKLKE